ncbi:MAG: prephenate dehydrogenase/arogenate dehydrogenase family protein [Acidobacteria bacterium]|nr:prephenate dehydrogenase/arogenate dehydrogenase family protein [Acidobacteriota bacterium]
MLRRIAVLGTGLIGGSFALAVRRKFPKIQIAGWDRPQILRQAKRRGAIQKAYSKLRDALRDADLIYVALPISKTLAVLGEVARFAPRGALVTDACSTKVVVCSAAQKLFRGRALFLGGHPIAGKENSGIENADADLFQGAKYILIGRQGIRDERGKQFLRLLRAIGASPVWMDAKEHDKAMALVSHLPQLAAIALALTVHRAVPAKNSSLRLAGTGLRSAMRLAGSPADIWEGICRTNSGNINSVLRTMQQALNDIRKHLATPEIRSDFKSANRIYRALRKMN